MNLFVLFSVLLLNNALPGLCVPTTETNCVENATLSRECNTCLCESSGNATLCKSSCDNSTVINDNVNLTNQVCQPNEVKLEDCNRCKCAANGIGWFCTRRACSPSSNQRHQRHASHCSPGTSWSEGCRICYFSETGAVYCTKSCTRSKRSGQGERRCEPGKSWKNQCNDCFCTETGVAACTLRGCFPRVGPPQITVIHPRRNFTHSGNSASTD